MRDDRPGDDPPAARPLIQARALSKAFVTQSGLPFLRRRDEVRAVDAVDLTIHAGETLGLVGESGSGKSTLGRVLLNLIHKTSGQVLFDGTDLDQVSAARMRALRRQMQIVFQDPYSSLHPRMTVRQTIMEGLRARGMRPGPDADRRIDELAEAVGLSAVHLRGHPHRLSGGQRQRVAIARALSVEPRFIVADEPVSALDVSIQAQILNLFADVQARFGLTYLFISHDLNVIRYLSDRVAVMYRGRIVEQAPARRFFANPVHPYARLLLSAMPKSDYPAPPAPDPAATLTPPGAGCAFAPRCPLVRPDCRSRPPAPVTVAPGHTVACLRAPELAATRPLAAARAPAPTPTPTQTPTQAR